MMTVELLFSRELYDERALRDAAEAFESFAGISVGREPGHFRISVTGAEGGGEGAMIIGEIMNFVLARTVELRAK
jgi:hypothetical protein